MRRSLAIVLTIGALGVLAAVFDLGAVAFWHGPEYVWRLVRWRLVRPSEDSMFPVRRIAASPEPAPFVRASTDEPRLRAAFAAALGAGARPGETMEDVLTRTGTTSFLVLRRGSLIYEGYFNGHARETPEPSFSLAKTVTALLIGAAIADGRQPAVDTPVDDVLTDVAGLRGQGVTWRHLLTMTSGFAGGEERPFGPLSTPWTTRSLVDFSTDLRQVAAAVRVEVPPGRRFRYDDRNAILLGMALERATRMPVSSYLERRLWQKIGAEGPASWSLDRSDGIEKMQTGISARAIDYLKLGVVLLKQGAAGNGVRVLPATWIEAMTSAPMQNATEFTPNFVDPALVAREFYGFLCWGLRGQGADAEIYGDGTLGQVLYISRSADVIILRLGVGQGGISSWPEIIHQVTTQL